jgi:hypothetical protein
VSGFLVNRCQKRANGFLLAPQASTWRLVEGSDLFAGLCSSLFACCDIVTLPLPRFLVPERKNLSLLLAAKSDSKSAREKGKGRSSIGNRMPLGKLPAEAACDWKEPTGRGLLEEMTGNVP